MLVCMQDAMIKEKLSLFKVAFRDFKYLGITVIYQLQVACYSAVILVLQNASRNLYLLPKE